MRYLVFLQKGDINDATSFYVQTIEKALRRSGGVCVRTGEAASILPDDTVIVIQAKAFFRVWLHRRSQKIAIWFQGIVPEEAGMAFEGRPSRLPRMLLWRFLERFALKRACFIFFVSKAMVAHFGRRYGYRGQNHLVMPCFNLDLDRAAFGVRGKYARPDFVYAGGLSAWQCFGQTLRLFKAVESLIPEARLTVLTAQQAEARRMVAEYGIERCEVKYLPSAEVGDELARHKYGFLLREDHIVNNVATPTKMNSYLAAGVIPVYTDVIGDFKTRLSAVKHAVRLKDPDDVQRNAALIAQFERTPIDPAAIRSEYAALFADYYNREKYIELIREKI